MNTLRKKHTFARYAAAFLLAFFLCTLLLLDVHAESAYTVADFEADDGVWRAGENSHTLRFDTLSFGAEKRSLLEVTGNRILPEAMRTVTAHFDEPLDLSAYRTVKYDVYIPLYTADPNATYYTRLTLTSQNGESENYLELVTGGDWTTVEFDVSPFDGRSALSEIEIAVTVDTTDSRLGTYSFYIDEVLADGTVDRELCKRFLFDVYKVKNGSATVSADKTTLVMVPSQNEGMSLEAAISLPEGARYANCLRIKLINRTENDTLTLYYSTYDTAVTSEDKSVTIQIEPNSGEKYYYASVGDVSMLQRIRLCFDKGGGRIGLLSISAVEAYTPVTYDTCGKINAAKYDADRSTFTVNGEIDRDVALANQSGLIALFSHDGDSLPTAEELEKMTPLVTGIMSARFELEWMLPSTNPHASNGRFIAVILCDGGGYQLIAPPFYADSDAAASELWAWRDAKGFAANDISLIGDVGTGMTVLELDLRRAFTSKREAETFIYNGEAYYLNKAYLDELYADINVLYDVGTRTLVRYSGWSRELEDMLFTDYSADDYVNHAQNADVADGDDYIGAISAYIAKAWGASKRIAGVIFGLCGNLIEDGSSLSESVSDTAASLRAIYMNIVGADTDARVYLSVSDLYRFDLATAEDEIGLCEYIPMLAAKCSEYGELPFGIAVDILPRIIATKGAEYVTASECDGLIKLLSDAGLGSARIIFCDSSFAAFGIGLADAMSRYTIGYYTALFNDKIDAYIALAGDMEKYVLDTVRYIDTTEAKTVTDAVESLLGGESLPERIDGWDKNKLPSRKLTLTDMQNEPSFEPRGSFPYYKFSGISSIGDIKPSYYTGALRVESDEVSVLSARLTPMRTGEAFTAWAGISHTFETAENFRITPTLALTLKLTGETDLLRKIPVKLVLFSENERFEALGEVTVGEWTTLYIDVSSFGGASDTTGLQLLVGCEKGGSTLLVRSLDGLSREYNDESLASVIAEARLNKNSPDGTVDYTRYLWIGGGVLIAVATVLAVALLSRKRDGAEE